MAVFGGGDPQWTLAVRQLNGPWSIRTLGMQLHLFDA